MKAFLLPILCILVFLCISGLTISYLHPESEKVPYVAQFEYPGFCDVVYLEIKDNQYLVSCKNFGKVGVYTKEYQALLAIEKALKNCSDPFDQFIGTIFLFDDTSEDYDCLDVWNREKPIGRFCPNETESDEYVYIYEAL